MFKIHGCTRYCWPMVCRASQIAFYHSYVILSSLFLIPWDAIFIYAFYANLSSLASRREDLSYKFCCHIADPASYLHSLLPPPPRPSAVTSRLRSSQIFPKVHTRTKRSSYNMLTCVCLCVSMFLSVCCYYCFFRFVVFTYSAL